MVVVVLRQSYAPIKFASGGVLDLDDLTAFAPFQQVRLGIHSEFGLLLFGAMAFDAAGLKDRYDLFRKVDRGRCRQQEGSREAASNERDNRKCLHERSQPRTHR